MGLLLREMSIHTCPARPLLHTELARKERERELSLDSEEMLTDTEPMSTTSPTHNAASTSANELNDTHSSDSSQECMSAEPVHASAAATASAPVSPESSSAAQAHASEPLPWNGKKVLHQTSDQ